MSYHQPESDAVVWETRCREWEDRCKSLEKKLSKVTSLFWQLYYRLAKGMSFTDEHANYYAEMINKILEGVDADVK